MKVGLDEVVDGEALRRGDGLRPHVLWSRRRRRRSRRRMARGAGGARRWTAVEVLPLDEARSSVLLTATVLLDSPTRAH